MKKLFLMLCVMQLVTAAPRPESRCCQCKKEKKKDQEIQTAALSVLCTAVNGAFALAANPDDKQGKLQFGSALANSFIGLVAAAMKSTTIEVYDAFGNPIAPDILARSIGARLTRAHLEECVIDIVRAVRSHK